MKQEDRRSAAAATRVDIDYSNPVGVTGQVMYALPLRATWAKSDDMVLSLDPVAMHSVPSGGAESAANSMLLLMASMTLFLAVVFLRSIYLLWSSSLAAAAMLAVFFVASLKFGHALARVPGTKPISWPTIFNRREGKVIQMRGKRRIEANWIDLLPHIETVNMAGSGISCNLSLLHLTEDGRRAHVNIQVARAQGIYDCLAVYEFVARYMEGDWDGLPDVPIVPGMRPDFWNAYRHGFWNPWIGARQWAERDRLSRARMYLWVPIWTVFFFPLVVLTIIGTRLGWEPRFPDADLQAARYDPARDGPVPQAVADKLRPPRTLHPTERRLYIATWIAAATLWIAGTSWLAWAVVT